MMVICMRWHWPPDTWLEYSNPCGLRPSSLLLGHGGSTATILKLHELADKKHCVSLKLECQSGVRIRDLRLPRQAALTTAPAFSTHRCRSEVRMLHQGPWKDVKDPKTCGQCWWVPTDMFFHPLIYLGDVIHHTMTGLTRAVPTLMPLWSMWVFKTSHSHPFNRACCIAFASNYVSATKPWIKVGPTSPNF